MNDVTWFGGVYLAFAAFAFLLAASRMGEHRQPITGGEVLIGGVIQALLIWGLFTVGVTS